jgi:dynein heavy chain, axonemal
LYVPSEALTIDNFKKEQEKKKNSLIYNLKKCSQEMHRNSAEGLKIVV